MFNRALLLACLGGAALLGQSASRGGWESYNGDLQGRRYSSLAQINKGNVAGLKLAWQYGVRTPTSANPNLSARSQAIPIVVGGRLYTPTGDRSIVALDPATGREIWKHDLGEVGAPTRGVSYWAGDKTHRPTILASTSDGRLLALDAATGAPVPSFGQGGAINLRAGVADRFPNMPVTVPSPGIVYKNLIITGSRGQEDNPEGPAPDVRAWDLRTGTLVWTFHTIPHPGEAGADTWPADYWKTAGSPGNWGSGSVDVERGLIFLPIGQPAAQYYGGHRAQTNLYSSSVVALDATTGKVRWHFQLTHHDVWDYDNAATPALVDIVQNGRRIPAVVTVAKSGLMFFLHRETGKPVYPVEERPVPRSDLPGEETWPTQPFPVKPPPLSRLSIGPDEIFTGEPEHEKFCRDLVSQIGGVHNLGPYTPYSGKEYRVIFPGQQGGPNFGGVAVDPATNYVIVNSRDVGGLGRMDKTPDGDQVAYRRVSPLGRGTVNARFWNPRTNLPCQPPPWAHLMAVNANTGDIAWKVTLGTSDELEAKGVKNTGAFGQGGPIVTAGGLVFIAGTVDRRFRAFDSSTGSVLWETRLDAEGHTTPMTYLAPNGKQYVVVMTTGLNAFALDSGAAAQTAASQHQEMVQTYCVTCHSTRAKMGGLALEGLNLQAAADNAEIWEKALRKLRGTQMPPPGSPQPPQKDVESFVAWMENTLDSNAKGPKAGYLPIQRLNRTEYAASVKALVGVDVNPKEVLPQDIQVEGFDNIADALSVSPAFLDQYVTAARHIAQIAVGNPNPRVSSVKYPVEANQNPDDPPPLGTWGGMRFTHSFPADAEYQITLTNLAVGPYSNALEREHTVVILIDGRTVFRKSIGGAADLSLVDRTAGTGRSQVMDRFSKIPVQVKAGVRDVVVAFVDRPLVETSENLARLQPYGGLTGGAAPTDRRPHLLDGVVVAGPFNPTGVSMTSSRALIFVCDPKKIGEPACARQITEQLARRAFRRPVTTEDVNRLMPFYEAERRAGGTFDQGIEQTVAAVLVSPQFLYRSIGGAKGVPPGTEFALTDLELASRLSFFLWNTGPDEELLTLASSNGLTRPGVMEKQARRMLADPRASSLVTSFAMKWLNLTTLDQVVPDPNLFRGFNEQLRRDFSTEVQAFIGSVFSDDRSVVELLTADYTFLNDRLASHYGIAGVAGAQFRKVTLTDKTRVGLLGKAAVQLRTSYGDRTSPVLRGAWVLDKLMGTPPTPPPPDTATDLSQKAGEPPKTVRARLEQHRDKATCRMCHGVIDPTGLALENFDAIGQWRTKDSEADVPIDASTVLPTGVAINGVVDLRAQLAARPDVFARTVTERLLMYAVNRRLEYFDMPQVRGIVRSAAKDNYTLSSLVVGIVNSNAFRRQGVDAAK